MVETLSVLGVALLSTNLKEREWRRTLLLLVLLKQTVRSEGVGNGSSRGNNNRLEGLLFQQQGARNGEVRMTVERCCDAVVHVEGGWTSSELEDG